MTDFLMNCWYMAGWSHEFTRAPLSRQLLGKNMVFYRTEAGAIVAMRDRCPHRFSPLSKGRIVGDSIQCLYHGLVFDSSGQCISAPLEERAPAAVRVQCFPIVERDNIAWFWPGEAAAADPSLIPDFSYLNSPVYKNVYGLTYVAAHYELETDNLMDLSHVELMHSAFAGALTPKSKFTATRTGNQVTALWFNKTVPNPSSMEHGPFPTNGAPIDQWLVMRWDPPCAMYLEVAVTMAGGTREDAYVMPGVHILTPQTDRSTLYFWAGSVHAEAPIPLDEFYQSFVNTFEFEDKPVLEAVAREMGDETDLLSMKPLLLRSDAGSVLARRVLAELIGQERQARSAGSGNPTSPPASTLSALA